MLSRPHAQTRRPNATPKTLVTSGAGSLGSHLCSRGGSVNIGNPDEITFNDLSKEIIELTDSESDITYEPLSEDDPQVRQPDISRAKELLDWVPEIGRREGLERTLEYSRKKVKMTGQFGQVEGGSSV